MKSGAWLLVTGALMMASGMAHAQIPAYSGGIGVKGGLFMPSDSKMRNYLGSTWISYGLSPASVDTKEGFKVMTDFGVLARRANGNRLTIFQATAGIGKTFGEGDTQPYFAIRIGPAFFDYAITKQTGRVSGSKLGFNGNIELGIVLSKRIRLAARYDTFSNFDGLKFDGLSFSLVYQVLRF